MELSNEKAQAQAHSHTAIRSFSRFKNFQNWKDILILKANRNEKAAEKEREIEFE